MRRLALFSSLALWAFLVGGLSSLTMNCASRKAGGGPVGDAQYDGEAGRPADALDSGMDEGGAAPGQGGAGGQGGAPADAVAPDSGETCGEIASEYANTISSALGCDLGAAGQCEKQVVLSLTCGCQTIVNDSAALDALYARWRNMGCVFGAPIGCPTGCPEISGATCAAKEGGTGVCVRTP